MVGEPARQTLGLQSAVDCAAATAAGHGVVLLVGDRSFFEPLGFAEVPRGQLSLPGTADPARILWRELTPGAGAALRGPVIPG